MQVLQPVGKKNKTQNTNKLQYPQQRLTAMSPFLSAPAHAPFENILLIASLMLECFFTNLLLMHVKLTPTVIGAAQRKTADEGERISFT